MSHTYQASTNEMLRQIYDLNSKQAADLAKRAQTVLATAGEHAALARDAATLLEHSDPTWTTSVADFPEATRLLRIKAWREALDFVEQHPEITIASFESFSIRPADDTDASPEFVESLGALGFEVGTSARSVSADQRFGTSGASVRIHIYARLPEPDPEPFVQASPAEVAEAYEDAAAADELVRQAAAAPETLSREAYPVQVDDRVYVHSAHVPDFPTELQGREGRVTAVDDDAFTAEPGQGANDDHPIDIVLDGQQEPLCFAVAEVTVLTRHEDMTVPADVAAEVPA